MNKKDEKTFNSKAFDKWMEDDDNGVMLDFVNEYEELYDEYCLKVYRSRRKGF